MPSNSVSMGYVMPPRVPTKRQSQYGGRQHTVMVFALERNREKQNKHTHTSRQRNSRTKTLVFVGIARSQYMYTCVHLVSACKDNVLYTNCTCSLSGWLEACHSLTCSLVLISKTVCNPRNKVALLFTDLGPSLVKNEVELRLSTVESSRVK